MTQILLFHAHNFGQIKELRIVFDDVDSRPIVIYGQNGAGKSTIFRALLWCLTGEVFGNEVYAGDIVRWGSKTGTRVQVRLQLGDGTIYDVERIRGLQKRKDGLYLYNIDGDPVQHGTTSDEKRAFLFDSIGVSPQMFLALAHFEQDAGGVLSLKDTKLTEFISAFLQVGAYKQMQLVCKERRQSKQSDLSSTCNYIDYLETSLADIRRQIDEWMATKESLSSLSCPDVNIPFPTEVLPILQSISRLHLHSCSAAIKKIEEGIRTIEIQVATETEAMRSVEGEIGKLDRSISQNVCPYCRQRIEEEVRNRVSREISEKEAEKRSGYQSIHQKSERIRRGVRLLQDTKATRQETRAKLDSFGWMQDLVRRRQSDVTQTKIAAQIEQIDTTIQQLWQKYKKAQQEILVYVNRHREIVSYLDDLDYWEEWAKHTYREQQRLFFQQLKSRIDAQLALVWSGDPVDVALDYKRKADGSTYDDKLSWQISYKGRRISADALSGGQKMRLNIIIQFSLLELVGVRFALFDEWFRSLDDEGKMSIWELLQRYVSQGFRVLAISHSIEWIDPTYEATNHGSTGLVLDKVDG